MRLINLLLLTFGLFVLAGCGGGGGDSLPSSRPASTVSGNAVDALIVGAEIKIFNFAGGIKAELLGSTITDSSGFYTLELVSPDSPVLIELNGGSYIEESSGASVQLNNNETLRAVTFYESGKKLNVMVTPWTNLAAGLAQYKIENGRNVNNAITEASTAISNLLGLDILTTKPLNVTDIKNATFALTDNLLYGFIGAGLSQYMKDVSEQNFTAPHSIYSSVYFSQVAYSDIRYDGLLNGIGLNKTRLAFGTVLLGPNSYRSKLGQGMVVVASSSVNKTALTVSDILTSANTIASSGHAIFDGVTPSPLDSTPPIISTLVPENSWKASSFTYSVNVSDFTGLKSVEFFVNGSSVGFASDLNSPSILINSSNYSDGAHLIGVKAIDNLNNEKYSEYALNFNNSGPIVNLTSASITNRSAYSAQGTWSTASGQMKSIVVNGVSAQVNADGTWLASIALTAGNNTLTINAEDDVANLFTSSLSVAYDPVPPTFSVAFSSANYSLSDGTSFVDTLSNATALTFPLFITTDKVRLNGIAPIASELILNSFPYIVFTASDPLVNNINTSANNLKVELQYLQNSILIKDWAVLPTSSDYVIPLTEEFLGADWHYASRNTTHTVKMKVTDDAGNSTIYSFFFLADVYIKPESLLSVSISDEATNYFNISSFNNRVTFGGGTGIAVNKYTFNNTTGSDIYAQISVPNASGMVQTVETGQTEDYVNLVTSTHWKLDTFRCDNQGDLFMVSTGCVAFNPGPTHYFDWNSTTYLVNYIKVPPAIGGTYTWRQCLDCTENIRPPAPLTNTALVAKVSDIGPIVPTASSWVQYDPDNIYGLFDNIPSSPNPLRYSWQRDYSVGSDVPFDINNPPSWWSIPAGFGFNNYSSSSSGVNFQSNGALQQRHTYSYVQAPGYPQQNFASFVVNGTILENSLVVKTLGGSLIVSQNGYYKIPAGITVTVERSVDLPAITFYNDVSVASRSTFSSYTKKFYDKSLSFNIARELDVVMVHSNSYAGTVNKLANTVTRGTGIRNYFVSR